jgi:hypothetical protein
MSLYVPPGRKDSRLGTAKKLIHNGIEYDAQLLIAKSDYAKMLFASHPRPQLNDRCPEHVFASFMSLVHQQNIELNPQLAPALLSVIQRFQCSDCLTEFERQIIQSSDIELILKYVITCPDAFPTLIHLIETNSEAFMANPLFAELPTALLGRMMFPDVKFPVNSGIERRALKEMIREFLAPAADPRLSDEDLEKEKQSVMEKLNEIKQKIQNADKECQALAKKGQEMESTADVMKKAIGEKKKTINIVQNEIRDENGKIVELRGQLESLKQDIIKIKKQKSDLENELNRVKRGRK